MKTIFDYNLTKKERDYFRDENEYSTRSQDGIYWDLGMLFWFRDEMEKVTMFGNRIKDNNTRNDFWRTVNHPH